MSGTISETDWQAQVVELAHLLGWKHLHVRRSIGKGRSWQTTTNVVGWPDLLMWSPRRPGRHIAAELKSAKGVVSDEQRAVLDDLAAAGFETYVWRPSDLDQVRDVLRLGRSGVQAREMAS